MFRAVMLSLVLSGLIKLLCWLFGWLPTLTYGELLGFYVFPIITLISVIHLIATTFISSLGFSRHPHQIQDVADSIRWVRDNIGEHCPEVLRPGERQPCGVFLSGHSAGAHLISLLMCEPKYLNQVGVPFDFVLGVMAISGVYTMTGPIGDNSILNFMFRHSYGASAVGLFDERALYEASPINFVHSRLPPFVVLSASSDYGLEVDSQRWVAKLSEHQVPTEYHVIPNTGHASVTQLHRNGALPILSTFVHKHHAIASSSRPINRVDK
jgi:acetyl esterase/lipase